VSTTAGINKIASSFLFFSVNYRSSINQPQSLIEVEGVEWLAAGKSKSGE
jgi:hypothetical protein